MSHQFDFHKTRTFEYRRNASTDIKLKHPTHAPLVIERAPRSTLERIEGCTFVIDQQATVGQVAYLLRKRIPKLNASEALFISLPNGIMPATAAQVGDLLRDHADPDGFLYLFYSGENVFG